MDLDRQRGVVVFHDIEEEIMIVDTSPVNSVRRTLLVTTVLKNSLLAFFGDLVPIQSVLRAQFLPGLERHANQPRPISALCWFRIGPESVQSIEVLNWSIHIVNIEFQLSIFTTVFSIIGEFEDFVVLSDSLVKSALLSPRCIIYLRVLHKGLDVFFPSNVSLYTALNRGHTNTAQCRKGADLLHRRRLQAQLRAANKVVLNANNTPLERVTTFKYLGQIMADSNRASSLQEHPKSQAQMGHHLPTALTHWRHPSFCGHVLQSDRTIGPVVWLQKLGGDPGYAPITGEFPQLNGTPD
jgi:hypothetical protein